MKTVNLVLCVLCLWVSVSYSQIPHTRDWDKALQKAALLSDVKTLALEIPKLDDQTGASATVHQAVRQLKEINSKPALPGTHFGMPAEFAPTASERDGILSTLGRLAKAVLPIDSLLAAEIVDDMVARANASQIDTTQGRTGIDSDLFKYLASKDEVRARSAAESFKDRLRRIVALAAIYQWKAKELESFASKVEPLLDEVSTTCGSGWDDVPDSKILDISHTPRGPQVVLTSSKCDSRLLRQSRAGARNSEARGASVDPQKSARWLIRRVVLTVRSVGGTLSIE